MLTKLTARKSVKSPEKETAVGSAEASVAPPTAEEADKDAGITTPDVVSLDEEEIGATV